jgi:hypothetical protein
LARSVAFFWLIFFKIAGTDGPSASGQVPSQNRLAGVGEGCQAGAKSRELGAAVFVGVIMYRLSHMIEGHAAKRLGTYRGRVRGLFNLPKMI